MGGADKTEGKNGRPSDCRGTSGRGGREGFWGGALEKLVIGTGFLRVRIAERQTLDRLRGDVV